VSVLCRTHEQVFSHAEANAGGAQEEVDLRAFKRAIADVDTQRAVLRMQLTQPRWDHVFRRLIALGIQQQQQQQQQEPPCSPAASGVELLSGVHATDGFISGSASLVSLRGGIPLPVPDARCLLALHDTASGSGNGVTITRAQLAGALKWHNPVSNALLMVQDAVFNAGKGGHVLSKLFRRFATRPSSSEEGLDRDGFVLALQSICPSALVVDLHRLWDQWWEGLQQQQQQQRRLVRRLSSCAEWWCVCSRGVPAVL
jgi:hypothetical protein